MGDRLASLRYFSGTGNTRRIAELCATELETAGYGVDLDSITSGAAPAPGSELACFLFPVYSLDLPRIAKRYLTSLPEIGAKAKAMLLVTGGDPDDFGWALETGSALLAARGYDLTYADLVHMPNNWGSFMQVPSREEAAPILEAGEAAARSSTRAFIAGQRYMRPKNLDKFGPLGSRLMRSGFKLGVKRLWSRFNASRACSSCGLCARACPTKSITMQNGRPTWSASCEQCLRCFNLCPSRAILQLDSIGHGSKRERWIEPHFHPLE